MINESFYKRPWYLFNAHLETIYPYLTSKIYQIGYERERIELEDGDFLDVDWVRGSDHSDKLLVVSHAFEGNSRDYFIERAARFFSTKGFDVLMWHFRSCSKELNRLPRFYHTGDTEDLHAVIQYGIEKGAYSNVSLLGFSMGGGVVANYLARPYRHSHVMSSVVFSTPIHLEGALQRLSEGAVAQLYGRSFLSKWTQKLKRKAKQFPTLFSLADIEQIRTLVDLQRYLLPYHNFTTSEDFFAAASCDNALAKVKSPLLIVNAQNDPILGEKDYPAVENFLVKTLFPSVGGHAGFSIHGATHSWMEQVALGFFSECEKNQQQRPFFRRVAG